MERVGERRDKSRIVRQPGHIPLLQQSIHPRHSEIELKRTDSELVVACGPSRNELEELVGTIVFD
jgi:hypothetical protein